MWYNDQNKGLRAAAKSIWHKLIGGTSSLLQQAGKSCLVCYRKHGGFNDKKLFNLICHECASKIPWIHEASCDVCGRAERCSDCMRRTATYFIANRSAVRYQTDIKEWLARYKYRGDESLKWLFALMLMKKFDAWSNELRLNPSTVHCFTYVPLSRARLETRGFNQAEQLARLVGECYNVPVVPLLKRQRDTSKQSYKTRADRLNDLKQAFAIDIDGLRMLEQTFQHTSSLTNSALAIWIIDDVYTTGSTMNQCAKTIHDHIQCDIYGLCIAR